MAGSRYDKGMTMTPNAPRFTEPTADQVRAAVDAAFDPDECEGCEINESTCWECAEDAIAELIHPID